MSSSSLKNSKIVIVGAGVFGIGAAIEFHNRGYKDISVIDPSAAVGPNPLASSTDISKIVRADYGRDVDFVEMAEESRKRFKEWNQKWGEELYHEVGLLVAQKTPFKNGDYASDSYDTMRKLKKPVEKLDAQALRKKYPKWNVKGDVYQESYFNPRAGWAQSGRVLGKRIDEARKLGVKLIQDGVKAVLTKQEGGKTKVYGVKLISGKEVLADLVLVAAGAWTPYLLPHLDNALVPTAQPVFFFQPQNKELLKQYTPPSFPVYTADIENTGFYGFPSHPTEQVLKVGNHGRGYPMRRMPIDKETLEKKSRSIIHIEEKKFRSFLAESFPELKDAKIMGTRLCMYCDSFDGNFFIGRDPEREGLAVAAGGSGHGFKFAPVIGDIIVDAVEGKETKFTKKFAWRIPDKLTFDVARFTKFENPLQETKSSL